MEMRGIEMMTIVFRSNMKPKVIENITIKSKKSIDLWMTTFGLFVICFKSTSIPAKNMR